MGFRGEWLLVLLLVAGCDGGDAKEYARLSGTIEIVRAEAQRAATIAEAAPFAASGEVDGARVLRRVAEADGRWSVEATGAEACLHSLDTGACGSAIDVVAGEVVDVIVTGRGRFSLRLDGDGARGRGAIPESYWTADPVRGTEIVVAPAPGWSGARIAAVFGLSCAEDGEGLCRLRAPRVEGDERTRLRLLLARCARLVEAGIVRYAEPNYLRKPASTPDDPLLSRQWALEQIRVQGLWSEGGAFADAVVAVVDTGVAPDHPDLAGRIVDGWDFVGDDDDPTDETADQSHGTMVAGIAAAATDNGTGVAGVAWGGRVMPLRVFDANGSASLFDIAQAIRYAAGLPNSTGRVPSRPAHVVNLSFAGGVRTQSEEEACREAHAAGTLVVAAVGNDGNGRTRYPAGYAEVLGVGATRRDGAPADYSNRGSQVSLVAPGGTSLDGILVPDRAAENRWIYRRVSGTSFAAPHVSGVAATLMVLGGLSPDEARALLEATARDLGVEGRDEETGWGLLDAHAATLALLDLPAPAIFPGESVEVRLVAVDSGAVVTRTETSEADGFVWSLDRVPAGRYRIVAGTDRDFDGQVDDAGELYGTWSGGADLGVEASDRRLNLSILVEPR